MFCPKCGAQNPDGAGFCGSCGAQFQQRQAPAAQPTPVPAGGAPAGGAPAVAGKVGGLQNPKMVGIIAGAVVLVVLIVLIRLFACSGGAVNLVDMVTKPSSDVANIVKGYKETSVYGQTVYTNNEEFVKDLATSSGDLDASKFKKYDGSYFFALAGNSGTVTLEDLNNGSNPNSAVLTMVVADDKLNSKGVADRVAKIAPYDKVYAYKNSSGDYISGMAKGNGCVTSFYADEEDGVWALIVTTYTIDSSSGSGYSSSFDSGYDNFDSSNYSDSYKK